jgi:hypothetical protein
MKDIEFRYRPVLKEHLWSGIIRRSEGGIERKEDDPWTNIRLENQWEKVVREGVSKIAKISGLFKVRGINVEIIWLTKSSPVKIAKFETEPGQPSIPVFIVDTQQSGTSINVPDAGEVLVPEDCHKEEVSISESGNGEDLYTRLGLGELSDLQMPRDNEPIPETDSGIPITDSRIDDFLGLYVSDMNLDFPQRIFVWFDKIVNCVGRTEEHRMDKIQALLSQVILHEVTHAYLDVRRKHQNTFTYANTLYKFMEEAFAEAISLHLCMKEFSPESQDFIRQRGNRMDGGYKEGYSLYGSAAYPKEYIIFASRMWRWVKMSFDKDIKKILHNTLNANIQDNALRENWLKDLTGKLFESYLTK